MWFWLSFALAHPAAGGHAGVANPNGGMPGQRLELRVEQGQITADYYVEIAAIRALRDAREESATSGWAREKAESFRSGLAVQWDGTSLPLTPVAVSPAASFTEGGFVEFHVSASARLPAPAGTLSARLLGFPDEPCYYAASVDLGPGWVVESTDLGRVKDGRFRDNKHGAWRRDDAGRTVTLTLRAARPWEDAAEGPLPARMAGIVPLRPGVWAGGAAAGGLGLLLGLGWLRRRRARR